MKDRLLKKALELGASGACWARSDRPPMREEGSGREAGKPAHAVLLVFCAYGLPEKRAEAGFAHLSNYYPASQKGYRIVKELERWCAEQGVEAREHKGHGIKQIAAGALGGIGKNTLFYHPDLGSLCSVHGLDAALDVDVPRRKPEDFCGGCALCQAACSTGAITPEGFEREKCVRHYMGLPEIPPEYARYVYQLSGCELCQAACPKNAGRREEPRTYDLIGAIEGKYLKEMKELIGPNFGKRRTVLAQAMACAMNTGYRGGIPAIRALLDDPDCGYMAKRALEELK